MRLKLGILLLALVGAGVVGYLGVQPRVKESLNTDAINLYWSGGYDGIYEAFDAFDAAITARPEDAEALAYRGALNGSWYYDEDASKADYEKARTLDPISGLVDGLEAYSTVSFLDEATDEEINAIQTQAQVAISAGNPIGLLVLGELASYQKDYDGAIEQYTQAIASDHKQFVGFTARLYAERGEALRHLKRYDEALADAALALTLVPEYDEALLIQDRVAWTTGDVDAALVTGMNLFWSQDYEHSPFDVFDAILESHPDNAQALAYRGAAYITWLYDYDAAEADYARSLELDPKSGLVEGLRAYVYYVEGGGEYEADANAAVKAGNAIGSYVLAQDAEYSDEPETAIAHYTQAIKDDSGLSVEFTAQLYAHRGELYRTLSRYEEASADVAKTLELDPDNYIALDTQNVMSWSTRPADEVMIEGITYFWSDDDRYKAYQVFDAVLQGNPDNAQALAYHAAAIASYDETAEDLFAQSLAIESTGLVEGLKAFNALENDEDNTAETLAKESVALGSPIGSFILGRVAYRADEYEKAIELYNEALAADSMLYPTFTAEVHIARARALRQLDRYDESIPDLTTAIELVPTDYPTVALRGDSYRMMSQYPRALKDLNASLVDHPTYMYALSVRADTYYFLSKYDLALADANIVLEDDPDDTFTLNVRARIYKELKNYDASLVDFTHSLEIDPEHAFTYGNRALLYLEMDSASKALEDINQALTLLPDNLFLLSVRGWIYRRLGDYDLALADFDYVLERTPNDDYPRHGRGKTYADIGRNDEALADYNYILERYPEHTAVFLSRARLYDDMGKQAEAIIDVKAALALEPENEDALAMLDDLTNPFQ